MPPTRTAPEMRSFGRLQATDDLLKRGGRALFLFRVEIGGNIFPERRGQQRLDIDQAQQSSAGRHQFDGLIQPHRRRRGIGEIDGDQDFPEHFQSPPLD